MPGFGRDDLEQEARIAVAKALSLFDARRQNTGRAFVATAVRNKLINVKRNATTNGRAPHDARGRLLPFAPSLDAPLPGGEETMLDRLASPEAGAEESASARELVRALDARLSKKEMALLVAAFVDGAKLGTARARGEHVDASEVERVRLVARATLRRLLGQRRMLTGMEHRVSRISSEDADMTTKKTTTNSKVKLPVVEELPDCHASLPSGDGYAADVPGCRDQCPDKFTCLRDLVDAREKNTAGYTLDADTEVKAVLSGVITYDQAIERMKKRNALIESGGKVPDSLSTTKPIVAESEPETPAAEPESADENESSEPASEPAAEPEAPAAEATTNDTSTSDETKTEDATMTKPKTTKTPKAKPAKAAPPPPPAKAAKPAKAPKAPKPPKAAKPAKAKGEKKSRAGVPRIPAEKRVAIYSEGHHRFLPQPRALDEEQFTAALGRVKLGQTFDLAVGMEIVRKRRDGGEVVVKIAKDGFVMDGVTYPSLSAAGQWASKRAVSGNDFFNTQTYSCTEIRGKGVPGGVFSKQGEGKPAIVGAHGAKDDAPAKPAKAAKKAAPAKPAKKAPPPPPKKAQRTATKAPAKKGKGSKKPAKK